MPLEVSLFISEELFFLISKAHFENLSAFYLLYAAVIFTQLAGMKNNLSLLLVSLVYYFRIFSDYRRNPPPPSKPLALCSNFDLVLTQIPVFPLRRSVWWVIKLQQRLRVLLTNQPSSDLCLHHSWARAALF